MVTVGIHQPGYLPWLGFFKKMIQCDVFVFFDDVQYERKDVQNRNKIRTHDGTTTLTIPIISKFDSLINQVKIDNTKNWMNKHKKTILHSYSKAKYFDKYQYFFEEIYNKKFNYLLEINLEIINFLKKYFNITTKTHLSSELNVSGKTPERILKICKLLDADVYISGTIWASKHLKIEEFKKNGIELILQEFVHPEYNQCFKPFIPNMSSIDLLFNEGNESENILNNASTIQKNNYPNNV